MLPLVEPIVQFETCRRLLACNIVSTSLATQNTAQQSRTPCHNEDRRSCASVSSCGLFVQGVRCCLGSALLGCWTVAQLPACCLLLFVKLGVSLHHALTRSLTSRVSVYSWASCAKNCLRSAADRKSFSRCSSTGSSLRGHWAECWCPAWRTLSSIVYQTCTASA